VRQQEQTNTSLCVVATLTVTQSNSGPFFLSVEQCL